MSREALLQVDGLSVIYRAEGRTTAALRDAAMCIEAGEGVGIVGESGSGKSTLARALIGLLPSTAAEIVSGTLRFMGEAIAMTDARRLAALRGRGIAMVFQDPLSYLNPLMLVRAQIGEAVRINDPDADLPSRVAELIGLVRLPPRALTSYPHELSGGMRQRVLIAIALACRPRLLIADEPTTALDVTTQAEILDLLNELRARIGMAIMLISHDLGVVAKLSDRIYVMYGGRVIESGPRAAVLSAPAHPYAQGLLHAAKALRGADGRFLTLRSAPPGTMVGADACPFVPRCERAMDVCRDSFPAARAIDAAARHHVRCHLYVA